MKVRLALAMALISLLLASACDSTEPVDQPFASSDYRITHLTHPMAGTFLHDQKDNPDLVILDVRTPEEFAQGHLKDAFLINFSNPGFEREVQKLDKKKTYFIYCHTGERSMLVAQFMAKKGFVHLYNLQRGLMRGYPQRPEPPKEDLKKFGEIHFIEK